MIAQTHRKLFVVVVTAAIVIGVACSGSGQDNPEDLSDLTPAQALERSRYAFDSANGFKFVLSHLSGSTQLAGGLALRRAEGTVRRPGDMKLRAEADFGRAFIRTDVVVIGEQTWMTNPLTGTWAAVPPGESPISFLDPIQVAANIVQDVSSPAFVGEPGASGRVRVEGTLPASAFEPLVGTVADTTVNVILELDARTFRLVRTTIRGTLQGGDLDSAERVIEFSEYDSDLEISPPF